MYVRTKCKQTPIVINRYQSQNLEHAIVSAEEYLDIFGKVVIIMSFGDLRTKNWSQILKLTCKAVMMGQTVMMKLTVRIKAMYQHGKQL